MVDADCRGRLTVGCVGEVAVVNIWLCPFRYSDTVVTHAGEVVRSIKLGGGGGGRGGGEMKASGAKQQDPLFSQSTNEPCTPLSPCYR